MVLSELNLLKSEAVKFHLYSRKWLQTALTICGIRSGSHFAGKNGMGWTENNNFKAEAETSQTSAKWGLFCTSLGREGFVQTKQRLQGDGLETISTAEQSKGPSKMSERSNGKQEEPRLKYHCWQTHGVNGW